MTDPNARLPDKEVEEVARAGIRGMISALKAEKCSPEFKCAELDSIVCEDRTVRAPWPAGRRHLRPEFGHEYLHIPDGGQPKDNGHEQQNFGFK